MIYRIDTDRGIRDKRPPNYSFSRTQFDTRLSDTPEVAQRSENSRRFTMTIPDIEELEIPRPG